MNSTTQFGNETTTKLQDHAHLGAETHMDCQTTAGLGLMNWRMSPNQYFDHSPLASRPKVQANGQDGLDWIMQWTVEGAVPQTQWKWAQKNSGKSQAKKEEFWGGMGPVKRIFSFAARDKRFSHIVPPTHKAFWERLCLGNCKMQLRCSSVAVGPPDLRWLMAATKLKSLPSVYERIHFCSYFWKLIL